jgi:hypothetical protein
MVEETFKKCIDLANQFKKECSVVIEEARGPCAIYFMEFISNFLKMFQNGGECYRIFREEAPKEEDLKKRMDILKNARTLCSTAIESGKKAKDLIFNLEQNLCILTGIETHKRKIEEDIKKLEETREEIDKEIRKILWKLPPS